MRIKMSWLTVVILRSHGTWTRRVSVVLEFTLELTLRTEEVRN